MAIQIKKIFLNSGVELDATALAYLLLSSKGNLVVETPAGKSLNIESNKHLKVKPGQGAQVEFLSDHTGNYNQVLFKFLCGLSADGLTELADERVIRGKFNLAELELNRKEVAESEFTDVLSLKFKDDNAWSKARIDSRNLDLCMHEHGGIALQPAGADSDGHTNKIKWEHSLKVPVEHFGEYASSGSSIVTTYSFTNDMWYCVGQVGSGAFQIIVDSTKAGTLKVLSKTNDGSKTWNDNMVHLGEGYYGLKNTPFGDFHIMWDESATATTPTNEAGAVNESATNVIGKYIYIRRLAKSGTQNTTRPALYGTTPDGETKYTISETEGGVQIATQQSGTSHQETVFADIQRNGKSYPVVDGVVTIDYCDYLVSNYGVSPVGSGIVYPVIDGAFTITPLYPFHYASKGGDGIEYGTFNPFHFSAWAGDYRFKADAPIYAVSRGDVEESASGKIDYPTQSDDTKDIIPDNQRSNPVTWNDIIKAVQYLKTTNPSIFD